MNKLSGALTLLVLINISLYAESMYTRDYNKKSGNEAFTYSAIASDTKYPVIEEKEETITYVSNEEWIQRWKNAFSPNNISIQRHTTYMQFKMGRDSTSEGYILGIQPISEIVGEGGTQYELRYGYVGESMRGLDKARAFAFAWNNPDKNNEIGLGIGGEWIFRPFDNPDFGIILGGKAGLGYQKMDGKTDVFSTNANKLTYVISDHDTNEDSQQYVATEVEYLTDTYTVSITFMTGLTYTINRHWSINGNLEFKKDSYQAAYMNKDSEIRNAMTMVQDSINSSISLIYSF